MHFRGKPIVIEAQQWDGTKESIEAISEWSGGRAYYMSAYRRAPDGRMVIDACLRVPSGGHYEMQPRDWIIKGETGVFYPCDPDVFELTYEPVEGAA